jgi:hypothetical protein
VSRWPRYAEKRGAGRGSDGTGVCVVGGWPQDAEMGGEGRRDKRTEGGVRGIDIRAGVREPKFCVKSASLHPRSLKTSPNLDRR